MLSAVKNAVVRVATRRVIKQYKDQRSRLDPAYDGLPPALWDCAVSPGGRLLIEGFDSTELARSHGTPLHVVSHARLVKNYQNFIGAFRRHYDRCVLATSYKTNPLPGVIAALHEAGTWAEAISGFELWLALKLGMAPERIILNGPGKGREAIDTAVANGIQSINLDNAEEINWTAAACSRHDRRQNVGIRVIVPGGWTSQFGMSISDGEAEGACARIAEHDKLRLCGLHVHLGTGIKDIATYVRALNEVVEFGRRLETRHGVTMDYYDFGGGFGVPTVHTFDSWDVRMLDMGVPARAAFPEACPSPDAYASSITSIVKSNHQRTDGPPPRIILEPGRAITSSAQTLLTSVITVKRSQHGRPLLIMDAGKHLTMPLGWEHHQIFAAGRMRDADQGLFDVYGPLCHPGDVVARAKNLPSMNSDDLLAIMDAGAYFIPNQMNFSHPRAGVVMVRDGAVTTIRRPEQFEDIVALDSWGPVGNERG